MLLLAKNVHEKTSQQVKTHKILKACMSYLLFALVLQLCMRMHLFSVNQRYIIFHVHYKPI